ETRLIIETIPVGSLQTNCYLIAAKAGGDALVIDPGGDAEKILSAAAKHDLKIVTIINTHGHWDHIGANPALVKATGAKVFVHAGEEFSTRPDGVLTDGETIEVGGLEIKVIHTPGHTPGSSSFLVAGDLFSGDLIFYESVGRTDLPGSDEGKLHESIDSKVLTLPDKTNIFPGHGPKTSVGWEREHNPYIMGGR
ncbi:MAG: MBL fold metallo-hydrolase, partial [Actinomycetota bacterium]|nr:MBL fold metallo-hydrolase [Actinomycetota bacterium]